MTRLFLYFYRRKWFGLIVMVLLAAISIPYALKSKVNLDFMRLLEKRGEVKQELVKNNLAKKNGSDDYIIIRVTPKRGDIVDPANLQACKKLAAGIRSLDKTIKVRTIFDLNMPDVVDGKLVSVPLLNTVKPNQNEQAILRKNINDSYPLVKDYISRDLKVATLLVSYQSKNRSLGYDRYVEIAQYINMHSGAFKDVKEMSLYKPRVYDWYTTTREVPLLSIIMVLILVVVVGFLTRNIIFSFILMIVIGFNLLLTAGFMGAMGVSLNLVSLILPFLVIVVGSTEVVHMLCAYVKGMRRYNQSSAKAAVYMIRQVAWPCVLTGLTTSVGVYSIGFSSYIASQHAGLTGGTAMLICGLTSLFMLPMLLAFIPRSFSVSSKRGHRIKVFSWVREGFVSVIVDREWWVFVILLVVSALSIYYMKYVRYDLVTDNMYAKDHVYTKQLQAFRKDFGGMGLMVIRIEGPEKGAFLDEANLYKSVRFSKIISKDKIVSAVTSYADAVTVIYNKIYGLDYTEVTGGSGLSLDNLFEGENISKMAQIIDTDETDRFVSKDFSRVNFFVRYKINNFKSVLALKKYVTQNAARVYGRGYTVDVNYSNKTKYDVIDMVFSQGVRSYAFCMLVIFIMFCVMYKSIRIGLLALIPNLYAAVMLFGYMGSRGIFLNPVTFTCFQFMLTIGVDFTIHLYIRYGYERLRNDCLHDVCREVVRDLVGPLFISTAAVFLPLWVGTLSSNTVLARYSELIGMGLFFSFVANIAISPIVFKRLKLKRT
jgi:uncharacterized protein